MSTLRPAFIRFALDWALQLFGSLLVLAAFFWWLTWPDEHFWQLCLTFVWALVLLAATACLVRTAFAAPAEAGARLPLPTAASCAAVAVWGILFVLLEQLLTSTGQGVEVLAVRLAQVLHLPPVAAIATLQGLVTACAWVVLPAVLLPWGAQVACCGWSGWRRFGFLKALRQPLYWAGLAGALVLLYLAYRLTAWVPEQHSLRAEMVSAGWRLVLAYLLGITSFVIAAWNAGCAWQKASAPAALVKG